MNPAGEDAARLSLDATILAMTRRARSHFGLAAREWMVFLTILIAAVQRYARAPETDPAFRDSTPLPLHLSGRISRRRVAEVTGLAPESVRRNVAKLMEQDVVREEDGGLHSRPGILAEMSAGGLVDEMLGLLCRDWGKGLRIVEAAKQANERLVAYRIGNIGLSWLISLQRQHGLAPATVETLLFLLTHPAAPATSERAMAEAAGIPRETLRRHIAILHARGLMRARSLAAGLCPHAVARHHAHAEARERRRLSDSLREDFLRLGVLAQPS